MCTECEVKCRRVLSADLPADLAVDAADSGGGRSVFEVRDELRQREADQWNEYWAANKALEATDAWKTMSRLRDLWVTTSEKLEQVERYCQSVTESEATGGSQLTGQCGQAKNHPQAVADGERPTNNEAF